GEAHARETLLVEAGVVAATQEAVTTKDQFGPEALRSGLGKVLPTDLVDVPCELSRGRITLIAKSQDLRGLLLVGAQGDIFGKDANDGRVLFLVSRRLVASDDVIVQNAI